MPVCNRRLRDNEHCKPKRQPLSKVATTSKPAYRLAFPSHKRIIHVALIDSHEEPESLRVLLKNEHKAVTATKTLTGIIADGPRYARYRVQV
jgi:hypothetical protein